MSGLLKLGKTGADASPAELQHLVRAGGGIDVERYAGYRFSSLAYNFIEREMEPMIVTLAPSEKPALVSHEGQEFNYVLQGTEFLKANEVRNFKSSFQNNRLVLDFDVEHNNWILSRKEK